MRTSGTICTLCFIFICILLFSSCGPGEAVPPEAPPAQKSYVRGLWENGVYTNTSLGFSLALPDGAGVMWDPSSLLEGTDILPMTDEADIFSGGTYCETVITDSSGRACAVLLVTDAMASTGVALTPEDYAQMMIRDLGASPRPTLSEESLGGMDYVVFRYPEQSDVYNTYFVGEKDGITIVWILSSHGRQRPSPEEMIRALKALDPPEEGAQESSGADAMP